jgi:hypothetical protein
MGMLSGDLIAFGIIGLATTLRAASSYWCVEQSGYRGLPHTGALSSKAKGSFLILEYQKSSATLSLATQLLALGKFPTANTAVRSWVRVWWVGDDFWYSSMRNPPTTPSPSELSRSRSKSKSKCES